MINRVFSFSGERETPFVIVGLVADALDRGPKNPAQPVVYTPYSQQRFGRGVATLRVLNADAAMIGSVRAVINAVNPGVPIQGLRTISSTIDEALRRERLLAVLGMLFGCLVLLLVSIGIYGLIAGAMAHRTSEIGIRIALGAGNQRVLWMFLADGLSLVVLGLVVGLAADALLTRFLGSQLFGVTPNDPATFAMAVGVMLMATVAASLLPALRASRMEPVSALRQD